MSGGSSRWAGPTLLCVLALAFFWEVLRGGCFFAADFHETFQPLRLVLGEALHRGWPSWDGRMSNGMPLLANPMHAAVYPLNLLFAAFPSARLLTWLTVLHVLFGSIGVWVLLRSWGLRAAAAWVGATVFAYNGAAVSASAFVNLCWSQAWLPWLLVAWERATGPRHRASVLATIGLAVVGAAMLSQGEPFVLLAGGLGVGLLSIQGFARVEQGQRAVRRWSIVGRPAVALLLAVVLVAPFLLDFARYVPESMRGVGFVPEGVVYWSMHPLLGLGLLLPGVFGDPNLDGLQAFWARTLAPEKGFPLLSGFYAGGLVLVLGALGVRQAGTRGRILLAWLVLLGLLALGRWGPVYPLLLGLPGFDTLRYPMKWCLPAMLPLALLAGCGVESVAGGERREARRAVFAALALLGLLAALMVAAIPGLDGWMMRIAGAVEGGDSPSRPLIRAFVVEAAVRAALPLLVGIGLLLRAVRRGPSMVQIVGLATLLTFDLGLANARLAPTVSASFYERTPPAVSLIVEDRGQRGRVYVEDPAVADPRFLQAPERRLERARWRRDTLVGYVGAAYGLDLAFNMDTGQFQPLRYAQLGSIVHSAPTEPKLMLLGAAGATHVVTYRGLEHEWLEPLGAIAGATDRPQRVLRNGLALPRARIVRTLVPYEADAGFIEAVGAGPPDLFFRAAMVETEELRRHGLRPEQLEPRSTDGRFPRTGQARIVEDRGRRLRLSTEGSGGWLVINDCWVPGWTARVDGDEAPLLRVDYAFRAVPVPPGEHEVVLRYTKW